VQGTQQLARTIPQDLDADTDQQECRKLDDYVQSLVTCDRAQPISKGITEIDGHCQESGADHCHENRQQVCSQMVRFVRAQRDRNRNRARADG